MSITIDNTTAAENILRRDWWITIISLTAVVVCTWAYLLNGAGTGMSVRAMSTWSFPPPIHAAMMANWTVAYWGIMLAMWWVMMIAMMLPSATPMILLFARVSRHGAHKATMAAGPVPTMTFLMGYLVAWLAFSAVATVMQWALEHFHVVHGMFMWSISRPFSALLLVAAGLYQFSGTKRVCLEHCRSPAEYLSRNWRDGWSGALWMGINHGAYCLGCCWALMALLFVGGAMNLVWIGALAALVLVEKVAPFGHRIAQVLGGGMVLAGIWLITAQ